MLPFAVLLLVWFSFRNNLNPTFQSFLSSMFLGKAILVQAWADPDVSKRLRLPDFKTIGTWKWRGFNLRTGHLYPSPQELFLVLISVRIWVDFRAVGRPENYVNEKFEGDHRESNPSPNNFQCSASTKCATAWPEVSNNVIYFKQTKLNVMRYKCYRRIIILIISKSFRKYVSNIPGNHEVKELQKTAILGTAHILRKVLT
jgi:hypothetical protein